ncbi:MAG: Ig-like domain-containing protein, partial [Bacteroidota bacterium]
MRFPLIGMLWLLLCLPCLHSLQAQADLELSISIDNDIPLAFSNVVYTATLTNKGPQTATNTVVHCPFPANLAYVENEVDNGFYNISLRRWNIGALASGDTATLDLTLFTLDTKNTTVLWEVEFTDLPDPDSSPNNGNANAPLEDDEAQVFINTADLELRMTASQTEVAVGDQISMTIEATNRGPNPLPFARGFLTLPEGIQQVDQTGREINSNTINWGTSRLAVNRTNSRLFFIRIDQIDGPITLYTQTDAFFFEGDPDAQAGNGTPPLVNEDDEAAITFVPAARNNPLVELSTNRTTVAGPFEVQLVFSDDVSGLETSDFTINNGQATALRGSGRTYSLTVEPEAFGLVTISLPAGQATNANGQSNDASNTLEVTFSNLNNQIDLELEVSVDNANLELFEERVFRLQVRNNSGLDAHDVVIDFLPPRALAEVNNQTSIGRFSGWLGEWAIDRLEAGSTATLDFTVFIRDNSEDILYYAQVKSAREEDVDSTPNNNPGPSPQEDDEALGTLFLSGNGQTDLSLRSSVQQLSLLPGQRTQLVLSLENESAQDAENISVEYLLPGLVQLDNLSSSQGTASSGTWTVSSLASGASATLQFDLTGGPFQAGNSSATFYAQIAAASPEDADSTPGNGNGSSASEDDEAATSIDILPSNSCSIDAIQAVLACDNRQTATNSDDTYAFYLEIDGSNLSNAYNVSGDVTQNGIAYGSNDPIGPFLISDGPLVLQISDQSSPNCLLDVQVNPPATCSSGSMGADIKLSLESPQDAFRTFDFLDYVLTVENEGEVNATGVVVRFDKAEELGITSSDPERGSFDQWLGQWTVGDLAAGERLELRLKYYAISEELSLTSFAELIALDQADFDSTPDNNGGPNPVEDDEASLELFTENYLGNPNPFIASFDVNTTVRNGVGTDYSLLIGNDGEIDLPAGTSVKLYFSINFANPFDLSNPNPVVIVEELELDAIAAGDSLRVDGSVRIDNLFDNSVAFYLVAVIDPDESLTEWKEDDNRESIRVVKFRNCVGDFFITDVIQMRNLLSGCTQIEGDLEIEGPAVNSLQPLLLLEEVTGKLIIESTNVSNLFGLAQLRWVGEDFSIFNNARLGSLFGLERLEEVSSFGILNSPLISSLSQISTLRRVTSLGLIRLDGLTDLQSLANWSPEQVGSVAIVNNSKLTSLEGLNLSNRIVNDVTLINNPLLNQLGGLSVVEEIDRLYLNRMDILQDFTGFENLQKLGSLTLEFNDGISSFQGLEQITELKSFSLIGNNNLSTLEGLQGLTRVEGDVTIAINQGLQNLNGFQNIQRIRGTFTIAQNDQLQNIDSLASLTYVGNFLNIDDNDSLENLDGLSELRTVGELFANATTTLTLTTNRNLEDCCGLLPLFNFGTVNGGSRIENNLGCNSEDDILTNCTQNRSSDFREVYEYKGVLPYKILKAYPNPVEGELEVLIAAKSSSTFEARLCNVLGQEHRVIREQLAEGLNIIRVQTADLEAGTYFL